MIAGDYSRSSILAAAIGVLFSWGPASFGPLSLAAYAEVVGYSLFAVKVTRFLWKFFFRSPRPGRRNRRITRILLFFCIYRSNTLYYRKYKTDDTFYGLFPAARKKECCFGFSVAYN
jgi:hypothetical protein